MVDRSQFGLFNKFVVSTPVRGSSFTHSIRNLYALETHSKNRPSVATLSNGKVHLPREGRYVVLPCGARYTEEDEDAEECTEEMPACGGTTYVTDSACECCSPMHALSLVQVEMFEVARIFSQAVLHLASFEASA